eukprot:g12579.t1
MKHLRLRATVTLLFAALVLLPVCTTISEAADAYQDVIRPFTQKYCVECHNKKKSRGELDFTRYARVGDVTENFRRWMKIVALTRKADMPPQEAKQPTLDERATFTKAVTAILANAAGKHAGDPGVIPPRRLTRTEYDLSIRDLTGIDMRPTRTFPPDPAAGEGFDNTGEALTMSPSLLKKYLGAAQQVANHMVLKTDGVTFAPFPVTSYSERKKLTEQAIIDFYEQHAVSIPEYLTAAWRYRFRRPEDRALSISDWAARKKLSAKYLAMVDKTLHEASSSTGYLKRLGDQWKSLPAPANENDIPAELTSFIRFVEFCRKKLCHQEERLIRSNAGNWPISHLDFRARTAAQRDRFDPGNLKRDCLIRFDRLRAPQRRRQKSPQGLKLFLRIKPADDRSNGNIVVLHRPLFSKSDRLPRNKREEQRNDIVTLRSILEQAAPGVAKRLSFGRHPQRKNLSPDSIAVAVPALIEIPLTAELVRKLNGKRFLFRCELESGRDRDGGVLVQHSLGTPPTDAYGADVELLVHPGGRLAKELATSAETFCRTFPNRFFYVDKQRGLAAGFHLVDGFFRDDHPLVEKVLTDRQVARLNKLWRELNFVTNADETLLRGFVWFERAERHVLHDKRFDFLRAEDPLLVQEKLLGRFERVYLGKMGVKLKGDTLQPLKSNSRYEMIHGFFQRIRKGLARQRTLMQAAESAGLQDLEALAARAYRRPLRDKETKAIRHLYQSLRRQKQGVEDSLRGVLVAVLMSPDFCYRFNEPPSGAGIYPLTDTALASRVSYFLWSSLPDEKLLAAVRDGKLHQPRQLLPETRRMIRDPKIAAFAREFFGQWLRYRDYLSKDPINAKAFPGYTEELRRAMFEEPIRLATDLIQRDRPITDLINSDVTFVNGVLARHYGGDIARQYQARSNKSIAELKRSGSPIPKNPNAVWHRVSGLRKAGRGGLFGMSVILTKNSKGERTSPVKRGFWAVHHLLGQHFPPPPTDVPELPTNEKLAKKTIRQLMVAHTAHPKCAMCHKHFDSLGLAMEGFDPIGRARTKDLAGRPVDNVAHFPNGKQARGISGLIDYVEKHRRGDFRAALSGRR